MRQMDLIAGVCVCVLFYLSHFPPLPLLWWGEGEGVSTHTSPYHTWSSLPFLPLTFPGLKQ